MIDCGGRGRAFSCQSPNVVFKDLHIKNGLANRGGGIVFEPSSSAKLLGCRIEHCVASADGGAVAIEAGADLEINHCEFKENNALLNGGAIAAHDTSTLTIHRTTILRNSSSDAGGGIYSETAPFTMENTIIAENQAFNGGAIFCLQGTPVLKNCTLASNTVSGTGGGIGGSLLSMPQVFNSILWGNRPDQIGDMIPDVVSCIVEGGYTFEGRSWHFPFYSEKELPCDPIITRTKFILLPSEVSQAGMIESISFFSEIAAPFNISIHSIEIHMGHTSWSDFTGGRISETNVYERILVKSSTNARLFGDENGKFSYPLQTPFLYDGTLSLLIEIEIVQYDRGGIRAQSRSVEHERSSYNLPLAATVCQVNFPTKTTNEIPIVLLGFAESAPTNEVLIGSVPTPWLESIHTNQPTLATDYRLTAGSDAIDKGTNTLASLVDLDKEARPFNETVDIGADEYVDADNDGLPDAFEAQFEIGLPSADDDLDGLTNSEEWAARTSPTLPDTDGDGILDGDEAFGDGTHGDTDGYITDPLSSDTDGDVRADGHEVLFGTDPTNAQSHPVLLSGTTYYNGELAGPGTIQMELSQTSIFGTPALTQVLALPGRFEFEAFRGPTNWLYGFVDSDHDGRFNPTYEASGQWPQNPFATVDDMGHLDVVLRDADNDEDGMADDWETAHFGNLDKMADDDLDGDGLSNLAEYLVQTNPNIADSDSDSVSDGDEVSAGSNPSDSSSTPLELYLHILTPLEKDG